MTGPVKYTRTKMMKYNSIEWTLIATNLNKKLFNIGIKSILFFQIYLLLRWVPETCFAPSSRFRFASRVTPNGRTSNTSKLPTTWESGECATSTPTSSGRPFGKMEWKKTRNTIVRIWFYLRTCSVNNKNIIYVF